MGFKVLSAALGSSETGSASNSFIDIPLHPLPISPLKVFPTDILALSSKYPS